MSDWTETALDSCVDLTKGVTYAAADYAGKGQGHPFLTIKSVKKGGGFNEEGLKYYKGPYKTGQVVKPGDLLVALTDLTRAGDIIGGPFRVPELGTPVVLPSMDLAVLREGDEPIDFSYLAYRLMLHDARRYMLARSAGTTVLHLDSAAALKFSFSRPGFEVQQRIAEILSTVDEAIEQTEALIAKTRQIKAGLMHDLFTRGVTPDGQLRPTREEAPQFYKESPLGWIPKEWEVVALNALAQNQATSFVNGPFGSDLLTSELYDAGVPVIYVQDVTTDGYKRVSTAHVKDEKANQLSFCNVRMGDVLVAKVGDPPGSACLYSGEERAIVTQDVIRIRPSADVDPGFLVGLLNSFVGRNTIHRIKIEGTRARVSLTDFKKMQLPRPSLDEQFAIAKKLDGCLTALASLDTELAKLKAYKKGLMDDLLTGHVLLPLKDTDEAVA